MPAVVINIIGWGKKKIEDPATLKENLLTE